MYVYIIAHIHVKICTTSNCQSSAWYISTFSFTNLTCISVSIRVKTYVCQNALMYEFFSPKTFCRFSNSVLSFEKFFVVVDVFACDACGRDRTFRCASRSAAACVSKHSKRDEILRLHITGAALEDGRCSRKRHAQNIATQSLRSEALVAFNQLITLKCTALLHLKETHGPSCPLSRFKTQQLTHKNHKTC